METEIATAISTAVSGATTDILSVVTTNLPVILGVGATFLAIALAWKLLRKFAR